MNPSEGQVDELLVQRMRGGDGVAFAALATRYWNALHRIGRNMLPDPSMAGDLAEATLLSAFHSAKQLPEDVPFRTSLYRQAMRYSLDLIFPVPRNVTRSLATYLPRFDPHGRLVPTGIDWSESGEAAYAGPALAERIRRTLQRLDALDRAAFVLRVIEELSTEETAAVLAISPESVRQRAHRATLILTGYLGELFTRTGPESLC